MATLVEHIKKHKPKGFKAIPIYSPEGDSLTFIFVDVEFYRQRIDDFLTVYRAIDGDHLVGCQLKGVPEVLDLLGSFDLTVHNKPIKLKIIFLGCMTRTQKEVHHFYLDLAMHDAMKRAVISPKTIKSFVPQQ